MRTEIEDLQAVAARSGAEKVFGVSAGALIALQAARTAPAIGQVAAYEPALLMDTSANTAAACAASTGRWPVAGWRTR